MSIDPKVIDAKNAVEAKRAQMMHTVKYTLGEAKRRLAPDLLAEQAWEKVKRKSGDLAHEAMLEAKARPALVGSIAAALGVFFARKPIGRMAVEAYHSVRGDVEDGSKPATGSMADSPAGKPPPRRVRRASPGKAPSVSEFHEATKPIEEKSKTNEAPKAPKKRRNKKTEDV